MDFVLGWPGPCLKVLGPAGEAQQQRRKGVCWPLPPGDGSPGDWTSLVKDPQPCQRGWHLCRDEHDLLLQPLGPTIWVAETHPAALVRETDVYIVASSARLLRRLDWDETEARMFAATAARRALVFFEWERPDDDRPWWAVVAAERYAAGQASADELAAARRECRAASRDVEMHSAAWEALRAVANAASTEKPWWDAAHLAGFCGRVAAEKADGSARGQAEMETQAVDLAGLLGLGRGVGASTVAR